MSQNDITPVQTKQEFMESNPGSTVNDYRDYIVSKLSEEDYSELIIEAAKSIIIIDLEIKALNKKKAQIKTDFTEATVIPGTFVTDAIGRVKKIMGWDGSQLDDEELVFQTILNDESLIEKMRELTEKYDNEGVIIQEKLKYSKE